MTHWTLEIPDEMDRNVREYLKAHSAQIDLSAFVQEAVGREILRRSIREIQEDNKDLTPEEAQALADEAVAWARADSA